MSGTLSINFLKDKMEEKLNKKVVIQYGCSICGDIFLTEALCDEHIANCVQSTLTARDPLEQTSSDRAPKRKLDHCVSKSDSASLFDDSTSDDMSDNESECKKIKEPTDMKEEPKYEADNSVYEATSQMLSDNEMLITLPYDQINQSTGGPLDFSNEVAIGFEQHTQELNAFQQGYKSQTYREDEEREVLIQNYDVDEFSNVDTDSTVNILSVFTAKPSQNDEAITEDSRDSQKSMDNTMRDSEEGDSETNTILTVLNTVDVNQFGSCDDGEVTVIDVLERRENGEKDDFEVEGKVLNKDENESLGKRETENRRPVNEATEENISKKDAIEETTTKTDSNKAKVNSSPQKKIQKRALSVKKQLTNKSMKDKNNPPKNQTHLNPQKARNANDFQKKDEMKYLYKEIKKEKRDQPAKSQEKPNKFSVYEFFDEEEEKLKAKLREDLEKEKALKRRTCKYCNEIFKDPMDVLRHKRQSHKFDKINMTKEEIEPYLNHKNKTECPLCFKDLGRKGYPSIYLKHMMTHCEEYNFACRVCGLQFRRKDHWENHENRHIVRPANVKKD